MKIFQILNGFCHYDATPIHPTLEDTVGKYAPDIVFVEAPDYVFEGWGYDETKEGDARFIQPTAPEGWEYNVATGGFVKTDDDEEIVTEPTTKERVAELEAQVATLTEQNTALTEQCAMLEECIVEVAQVVYA